MIISFEISDKYTDIKISYPDYIQIISGLYPDMITEVGYVIDKIYYKYLIYILKAYIYLICVMTL